MSEAAEMTLSKVSSEFEEGVISDLAEGKDASLRLIEEARKESTDATAKILEEGRRQAEQLRRQIIGSAELESRNMQLKALERAVNDVFDEANKRLASAPLEERQASLGRLIKEGMEAIGPVASVHCNKEDHKVIASVLKKLNKGPVKLSLSEEAIQSLGGAVLVSLDGSVRFDNTYEARLERMRPMLRKSVSDLLTGQSAGASKKP
ncbi:MAG TPA: V-type ATP synthase subunit E family protein [Nitrososphaerales archaeon]|nr:V-type ATP synthase subunit E family protein [Nitrososphaerales archaeon]